MFIGAVYKTFPKGINLKVNKIAQLKFELTYFEAAVEHFSHNTVKTPFFTMEVTLFLHIHRKRTNL